MNKVAFRSLMGVLVAVSFGCGGSENASKTSGDGPGYRKDAGLGGSSSGIILDAPISTGGMGGQGSLVPNLFGDAPTINGTVPCFDCADASVALDVGMASDAPGGYGGSAGSGGSAGRYDGGAFPIDSQDYGSDGSIPQADAGADAIAADAAGPCLAQIESVVPTQDWLTNLYVGANLVLRARIISGGGGGDTDRTWTWQVSGPSSTATPLTPTEGKIDPAAALFTLGGAGEYAFQAVDDSGLCRTSVLRLTAFSPKERCPANNCDSYIGLRASPPKSFGVPEKLGVLTLFGKSPFAQTRVILANGVAVRVEPSIGGRSIASYVRINNLDGSPVSEGYADPDPIAIPGFNTYVLPVDDSGRLLQYDVLVVPLDGPGGKTVGATAPQLFHGLTTSAFSVTQFILAGGLRVTGQVSTGGVPVVDARLVMSNKNPAQAASPSQLVFSSVGSSDATGSYSLNVQPGSYWMSISPPADSGLAEASTSDSIAVTSDTTVDFQWSPPVLTSLTLSVVDMVGAAAAGAEVRLVSQQSTFVGNAVFQAGTSQGKTVVAMGKVDSQATTSLDGTVVFSKLPANSTYDVLLVPASPSAFAATTRVTVQVGPAATFATVKLLGQSKIIGKLVTNSSRPAPDWTTVQVVAYDKSSEAPESPRSVAVSADGTFSISVTPSRPYVLLAIPPADSGLARTFVGPGTLRASEFTIQQKVQLSMDWTSSVVSVSAVGLAGTSLQAFCMKGWAGCVDSTIPLAETTAGAEGAFRLALPDPASR